MTLQQINIFYKNLAEMYGAGISFVSLFESLRSIEKNEARQFQIQHVIDSLRSGKTLTEALRRARLVPVFDIPVIQSAEKSGKLLLIFESLSKKYQLGAQAEKNFRTSLMSSFLTLTAGLFILPFADLFTAKITWSGYCLRSLVPFALIIATTYFFNKINRQAYYDLSLAQQRYNIIQKIPYLSGLNRKIALEKFTASLSFMLDSGLTVFDSLELAGRNSADGNLYASTKNILRLLKSGCSLPQAFQKDGSFPSEVINSIKLGSESGKIPDYLQRSSDKLNNEINDRLVKLSKALPHIIYGLVSLYIAWRIVGFYTGHLNQINSVI